QFVAVGGHRRDDGESTPYVYTSSDGENWQPHEVSPYLGILYDIAYANGLYVAVGGEGGYPLFSVLTSRDGISWDSRTFSNGGILQSIAYGNGRFVTVQTPARSSCPLMAQTGARNSRPL